MPVIITGSDYQRHFDAERYLEYMYSESVEHNGFVMQELHKIFAGGEVKGHTLLDIGSGPSIHTIISAINSVDEVYLSDYADQNLKVLNDWLKGERSLQNGMVKFVCDLENEKQSYEERVSIMRKKVKGIFHIDVTSLDSLSGSDVPKQYDVITSSWCLDSAGSTHAKYIECVNNIFSLLKPGGHLVLIGDVNSSEYKIDDVTFKMVHISSSDLKTIYENAGFGIAYFNEITYKDEEGDVCNKGVEITSFVMTAKRNN